MVASHFHSNSTYLPSPNLECSYEERQCQRLKSDHGSSYHHRSVQSQRRPSYESIQIPKSYDTSKLPFGWLDCSSFGEELNFMIPSKVPLDESYNAYVPHGKRYSFKQAIEAQRCRGRKIGLVIDLTNTTRYYRTSDLARMGVRHIRIPCIGRNSVPDNFSVNCFVYEVMRFKEYYPDKYILVHCTHGHNRTGFMIVHYLMRTQPMKTVTQAIQDFAQARPPGIYKPDYIDAFYSFYHEMKPFEFVCPRTPEWKRSETSVPDNDLVLNHSNQDRGTDGVVMTNDDILGDKIPEEQQEELRRLCYELLKAFPSARGRWQFQGSHPVSLNWENVQLLRQQSYYATWKADGTRYMVLITVHGCYLIDRSFNFRRVQMRFPQKHIDGCNEKTSTHYCTLLDGEMVIDTELLPGAQKKQTRRYLVYDMMALNNVSVVDWPFRERSRKIEEQVIGPRTNDQRRVYHESRNNVPEYRYDLEPFRVRMKGFWPLCKVKKILNELVPKLSHDADGVIFQGLDDPYVIRKHEGLLKWKYPDMNSVDFLFEVGGDGQKLLYLYAYGKKQLMKGEMVAFRDSSEHYSFYSGKIIECFLDSEKKEWVYMRSRTDKSTPNDVQTYKKVKKSIEDNITEEVLLKEIDNIILLPMYVC